jgi:GT2 family glycosyltransferase
LEAGYYNVYVPDVVLYHYESATRGHPHQNKVSYERHLREVKYFKDKWTKYLKNDPFYNPNLTLEKQHFEINYNS